VLYDTAYRNRFNPVRDFLNAARPQWDGKRRIGKWLATYFGAADTTLNRRIGLLWFIAAARRAFQPGCKFDELLILESPQGTEKSTGASVLAIDPDWFNDHLPFAAKEKEKIEAIMGYWIIEAAEISGLKRDEVETVKAFLSRTKDGGVR